MATRSRRVAVRRSGGRSAPSWGMIQITQQTIAASAKLLLGSFILSNPPLGETVLRTRCQLWVGSDQTATDEFQIGAFGLMVVTDAAIAIGTTAIPGPADDGGDDGWFVHQAIVQKFIPGATNVMAYTIDSKAMRKVEDGYAIAIMVENSALAGVGGLTISTSVRMLTKLTEN